MHLGKTLFAPIIDFLPWKRFHRIVVRRKGNHYIKHFSSIDLAVRAYALDSSTIELCLSMFP